MTRTEGRPRCRGSSDGLILHVSLLCRYGLRSPTRVKDRLLGRTDSVIVFTPLSLDRPEWCTPPLSLTMFIVNDDLPPSSPSPPLLPWGDRERRTRVPYIPLSTVSWTFNVFATISLDSSRRGGNDYSSDPCVWVRTLGLRRKRILVTNCACPFALSGRRLRVS